MPSNIPNISYEGSPIIETQNYTTSCSMTPNFNETIWYQWRKYGEDVGEETESGVLCIPSIKRTDAGNYTCRGRNVAGYSDSDPVTVVVHCKCCVLTLCTIQYLPTNFIKHYKTKCDLWKFTF